MPGLEGTELPAPRIRGLLAAFSPPRGVAVPVIRLAGTAADAHWQITRARGVRTIRTRTVLRLSSMAMIHDPVMVGAAAMPR